MTPQQYAILCLACHSIDLGGAHDALRRRLVVAVTPFDPALAAVVAGMSGRQVACLRGHFERMRDAVERRGGTGGEPAPVDLSFSEWRTVARSAALLVLRGVEDGSFHDSLVREVGGREPALAEKLGRLDGAQAAALRRRVRSGNRWSP
jgi:hypothetical protein